MAIPMEPPALREALAFAAAGFAVLPLHGVYEDAGGNRRCTCPKRGCTAGAKHPVSSLVPRGLKHATTDEVKIRRWFTGRAWLNYGITTNELVVVDTDPRKDGDKTWLVLVRKPTHFEPHSWRTNTGGGGQHLIFRQPKPPIRSGSDVLGRGVDLKGIGGYIVGPGSLHLSGKRYWWAPQCSPSEVELAEMPAWLLALAKGLRQGNGARPVVHYRSIVSEPIPEGRRHDALKSLCGHLLAKGIDEVVVRDIMLCVNAHRCLPPLTEADVVQMWRNILKRDIEQCMGVGHG